MGLLSIQLPMRKFFGNGKPGLEIFTQKEQILPDSDKEMSWKIGEYGFMMRLTKKVPVMLARKIEDFVAMLFYDAGLNYEAQKHDVIFAIHPGGPKIIDLVIKVLGLKKEQVHHSRSVLKRRGNMSSATIPYIWNNILSDPNIQNGRTIVTVAFGPGLTITGALLKVCMP